MSGPTYNATAGTAGATLGSLTATGNFSTAAGIATNDTIVVLLMETTGSGATSKITGVADGQGSYTPRGYVFDSGSSRGVQLWTLKNAVSGAHSITVTVSATVTVGYIWASYSNAGGSDVDPTSPATLDQSSSIITPTINTGSATYTNGTVISTINTYGGASATSSTGTIRSTGGGLGGGNELQDQTQSGSGVATASYTFAVATGGVMNTITLQNLPFPSGSGAGNFFLMPGFTH